MAVTPWWGRFLRPGVQSFYCWVKIQRRWQTPNLLLIEK
jgi:hypothetical protein